MNAWSRGRTLGIGLALIVLTNAVALGGVWWNRSAAPDSSLTLSERELGLPWRALRNRENSGLDASIHAWRCARRSRHASLFRAVLDPSREPRLGA